MFTIIYELQTKFVCKDLKISSFALHAFTHKLLFSIISLNNFPTNSNLIGSRLKYASNNN